jgi:hypothetical protein
VPSFGAFSPFPFRFGGGKPPLEHRVNSVLAQLGTTYTKDTTGIVWLRAMAWARVFWDVWETNQRLANQWDPRRMTDFLGRWEKILALPVGPDDSLSVRRARVGVAKARAGYANAAAIFSTSLAYLGASVFVGIITSSSSTAVVWTPSGWPMGSHPVLPTDPDWYSTVAYVAVKVQKPSTMDDGEFYTKVGSVLPALDAILPSWVTFDWYREDISGASGFFLDDTHNLDDEAFD